jgi:hypothetical protein
LTSIVIGGADLYVCFFVLAASGTFAPQPTFESEAAADDDGAVVPVDPSDDFDDDPHAASASALNNAMTSIRARVVIKTP